MPVRGQFSRKWDCDQSGYNKSIRHQEVVPFEQLMYPGSGETKNSGYLTKIHLQVSRTVSTNSAEPTTMTVDRSSIFDPYNDL